MQIEERGTKRSKKRQIFGQVLLISLFKLGLKWPSKTVNNGPKLCKFLGLWNLKKSQPLAWPLPSFQNMCSTVGLNGQIKSTIYYISCNDNSENLSLFPTIYPTIGYLHIRVHRAHHPLNPKNTTFRLDSFKVDTKAPVATVTLSNTTWERIQQLTRQTC